MEGDATERAETLANELLHLMPRFHRWAVAAVQTNRRNQDPSLRQLAVLYAVRDGVTSPVHIARRLRVNRAVVTGLLDRLEQRGLVKRATDPTDRRRQRIVLTAAGVAAQQATERALVGALAGQLSEVSVDDIDAAERTVGLLNDVVAAL